MPLPFNGQEFVFHNPDGTEVRVRGWGNQFAAVFETPDGHTVIKDEASGYYEYATLTPERDGLPPSGLRVGTADAEAMRLPLHLRAPRAVMRSQARSAHDDRPGRPRWELRRQERREAGREAGLRRESRDDGGMEPAPEEPEQAPVTGNYVGLCLLVAFPDVPATIPQAEVDRFCNQAGYTGFTNNGSVRDYFLDVSDGKLDYRNQVTAYYTARHSRDHYTDPAIPYGTRAQELIVEALDSLRSSGHDFAPLTADAAGFVQALNVFYAGDRVNNWSEGLWPHAWTLANPYVASPTRTFADYQITNMGVDLTLRTFCHESGHMVCDFPDLYDYGGEGNGVGDYCLMCYGGSEFNPVQVDAYLKDEAGWTSSRTTLVPGASATIAAGRNEFLVHARDANEFFILENRAQTGRDRALPDAGLAIWHVDRLGSNNNEQMTATEHYECSLEQADNRFDLERAANAGDVEDLFGAPSARRFGAATAPSSTWWDGTASGLEITEVTPPGPTITVTTTGAAPAMTRQESTADVTGDGRADVVGFGEDGVWVSLNAGNGTFRAPQKVSSGFGYTTGWRLEKHPRFLADLTGDGRADLVGFGEAGVWVSLNSGDGTFAAARRVVDDFGYSAGGWRVEKHPRFVAPLVQPGRGDLIGFGHGGVWTALNAGNGTFQAPRKVLDGFGYASGWRVEKHLRFLADLTGDGRADIVGFGENGVWVALNTGDGTFQPPKKVLTDFGYAAGGWRTEKHPRFLVDLTGDGRADVVGFGEAGVWVSLNAGNGTFAAPQKVSSGFGYTTGWRVDKHPRLLADLTGDGRADVVGFGEDGVWVALNGGNGTFAAARKVVDDFGYSAGGWRVEQHPRSVAPLVQPGRADLIGFGQSGVWTALNAGNGTFAAARKVLDGFGYASGWRVEKHLRLVVGPR